MNISSIKGYGFAALAAAAYGTNPAFAVPLYEQGMNPNSVLLFRYVLGLPILAVLMRWRGVDFHLSARELSATAFLGIMMGVSSLTLFESYNYMNSGVASTLLFVYPILVALIMIARYKEKFRVATAICLIIMSTGLLLLLRTSSGESLSGLGCLLVFISALTYAIYIVYVNVSHQAKGLPTSKLLFYVLAWGSILFIANSFISSPLTLPSEGSGWINLAALACIPTIISLAFTTLAIQLIGSTPTAILGALEPVSAVVLSVIVLHQGVSPREVMGVILIIVATTIVVADKSVDRALLHVRKFFPRRR